jgi:sugar-specific transcriptional regulator TrmB
MIIVEETEVQEVLRRMRDGARSVKDLSRILAIPAERVFRHVSALKRRGFVEIEKIQGRTPFYHLVPQEV